MASKKPRPTSPRTKSSANTPTIRQLLTTFDGIKSIAIEAIRKIRYQPFLFVIAITALLIGFSLQATSFGTSDLRFLILVITILSFIVILGSYVIEALRILQNKNPQEPKSTSPTTTEQKMTATGSGAIIENGTQSAIPPSTENIIQTIEAKNGGVLVRPSQTIEGNPDQPSKRG